MKQFFSVLSAALCLALAVSCSNPSSGPNDNSNTPTADFYTVTFDSQGATTAATPATMTVTSPARTVAALPTDPVKTGSNFGGWWTEKDGMGTQFTATTTVAGNTTVHAKWIACTSESSFVTTGTGSVTITGYSGTDKNVVIPSSIGGHAVVAIGDNSFKDKLITSVIIPYSVASIGKNAFTNCFSLTSVKIPNSVTSIGDEAFDGCTHLSSIIIPDSVISIGAGAFGNSAITSITIPDSVSSIGQNAFYGCYSLTSVIINATTPPALGTAAFPGYPTSFSIKVPAASVDDYKTNWSAYEDYIFPQ